ncbi:MAG: FeoB-associated Cys-rich membrane protein [Lachnospiraceae bacterium]
MENVIIIAVLLLVVGFAVFYLWKERKKGVKCIGCPSAKNCCCRECKGKEVPK